jgi:hypothetical protein
VAVHSACNSIYAADRRALFRDFFLGRLVPRAIHHRNTAMAVCFLDTRRYLGLGANTVLDSGRQQLADLDERTLRRLVELVGQFQAF